ncbi:MAG: arginase [Anaerolineae bacterium]|nr:arginase [Anaerolineae bacterium]MDQ7036982.1 arginase [Anaerolineae bacterium]
MIQKTIRIFGIPMDLGQNRRGVDMGPSAVRYAQLKERIQQLGFTAHDEGNITVSQAEETVTAADSSINAHFLPQVTQVCQSTYEAITDCWQDDEFGLFIGGDHSLSIGTIAAVAARGDVGVLWVDAHTDMNTPQTSPSGNIHGMSVATLLGDGAESLVDVGYAGAKLKPENVAMVGIRSVDGIERDTVRKSRVTVHTMSDIDVQGIHVIAQKVLDQFAHLDRIHVSFDLDSCEPRIAPGVGTPVMGGLTYREAHLLMEILSASGKVYSMDVVEINPILDSRNQTAKIAVEMILSLLGKQIL